MDFLGEKYKIFSKFLLIFPSVGRLLPVNTVRFIHVSNIFYPGENHEKKKECSPKFSQNENIFVKIGKLSANFDKNISFWEKICLFLMIFLWFLSVCTTWLNREKNAKNSIENQYYESFKLNKEMHGTFGVCSSDPNYWFSKELW